MSNEAQQYSLDNQRSAINEYAVSHGFVVVKTYADAGKSGVIATNRNALRELLRDVSSGQADYKVVLVYDVSRWGRFPDNDEAAHYEFLCSRSGIPLHYCAEQFKNDGTPSSSLLKALKRNMAAEFSRELGERVFRGKARLVRMGYWVGGTAGYAYRRMMVSAEGKVKQLMKCGEQKSLTTDRVVLVPGPKRHVECVRRIFSMVLAGQGCSAIARELNRKGSTFNGRRWAHQDVSTIVTNPKYAGWNVWHRNTQRLRGKSMPVESCDWISKRAAFTGIVDQDTFDTAQAVLPKQEDFLWSDEKILKRFRRLLKVKGHLSEAIVQKARGMPVSSTVRSHFGSTRRLYELLGYYPGRESVLKTEQLERSATLRRSLFKEIKDMFPGHVAITHLPRRTRSILRIDDRYLVSILLVRQKRRQGGRLHWVVEPCSAEREHITLLCKMTGRHDRILESYLFPRMDMFRSHRSFENDPWLKTGVKLNVLSDFYKIATRMSEARREQSTTY
jgi:DNA invertase Pin-like site-specific DNA recombinase